MDRLPFRGAFSIAVFGVSAHGATPHLGRDALVAASAIILELQTVVSRAQDPLKPLKLSVCAVRAGKEYNIICDRAELSGTLRAQDKAAFTQAAGEMERVAARTAESMGCTAELAFADEGGEQS